MLFDIQISLIFDNRWQTFYLVTVNFRPWGICFIAELVAALLFPEMWHVLWTNISWVHNSRKSIVATIEPSRGFHFKGLDCPDGSRKRLQCNRTTVIVSRKWIQQFLYNLLEWLKKNFQFCAYLDPRLLSAIEILYRCSVHQSLTLLITRLVCYATKSIITLQKNGNVLLPFITMVAADEKISAHIDQSLSLKFMKSGFEKKDFSFAENILNMKCCRRAPAKFYKIIFTILLPVNCISIPATDVSTHFVWLQKLIKKLLQ